MAAGGGANPFPWPAGLNTVQTDKNGNILRMEGTDWWMAHEFDYEQRMTRVRAANGDIIVNEYDAMGARLKELKTSGGSTMEKRMVYALGRLIQERDGSDAVTARYYWGDVAAGNGQTVFKKDNGESAKYFVPEERGPPLENFNKDGTLSGARAYDAFGVTNYSSGTALTPFELSANMRLNGSHLTLTPVNGALYPELGRAVTGWFRLTHMGFPCCFFGWGWCCEPEEPEPPPPPPHPEVQACYDQCTGAVGCDWYRCMCSCTHKVIYCGSILPCEQYGKLFPPVRDCLIQCQKERVVKACQKQEFDAECCSCCCHHRCFDKYSLPMPHVVFAICLLCALVIVEPEMCGR